MLVSPCCRYSLLVVTVLVTLHEERTDKQTIIKTVVGIRFRSKNKDRFIVKRFRLNHVPDGHRRGHSHSPKGKRDWITEFIPFSAARLRMKRRTPCMPIITAISEIQCNRFRTGAGYLQIRYKGTAFFCFLQITGSREQGKPLIFMNRGPLRGRIRHIRRKNVSQTRSCNRVRRRCRQAVGV